jgi:hypothetical protein
MPLKTRKNYSIEQIQYERSEYVLTTISNMHQFDKKLVYVFGTGKQSKTLYEDLRNEINIEVIWYDFVLDGFFKWLKLFISGYAGLIKIKKIDCLKDTFNLIGESSLAVLYIIDESLEKKFIEEVKRKHKDVFLVNDYIVNNSDNYFIYMLDTDAVDSTTGIYEIKTVGNQSELKNVVF